MLKMWFSLRWIWISEFVSCHFRSIYKVKYISVELKSSRSKRTNGEPIKQKSLLLFQVKHNEEFQTGQIGQHVRLQITPTTANVFTTTTSTSATSVPSVSQYSDFVVRRSGQSVVSEPRRVHSARRSQGTWEGEREKGNFWNQILFSIFERKTYQIK